VGGGSCYLRLKPIVRETHIGGACIVRVNALYNCCWDVANSYSWKSHSWGTSGPSVEVQTDRHASKLTVAVMALSSGCGVFSAVYWGGGVFLCFVTALVTCRATAISRVRLWNCLTMRAADYHRMAGSDRQKFSRGGRGGSGMSLVGSISGHTGLFALT